MEPLRFSAADLSRRWDVGDSSDAPSPASCWLLWLVRALATSPLAECCADRLRLTRRGLASPEMSCNKKADGERHSRTQDVKEGRQVTRHMQQQL